MITFEFENVPAAATTILERLGAPVAPGSRALAVAQDRLEEKTFLNAAGIATVGFAAIDSEADLRAAFKRFGAPLLLKTRQGGYDGKGQAWAHKLRDGPAALASLGGQAAIAETPADFRREVALIAARGRDGEIALYPLTESPHENGILAPDQRRRRPAHRACSPRPRRSPPRCLSPSTTSACWVSNYSSATMGACWSTSSRPAFTTPATGHSTDVQSINSSSTYGPSPAGLWAPRRRTFTSR